MSNSSKPTGADENKPRRRKTTRLVRPRHSQQLPQLVSGYHGYDPQEMRDRIERLIAASDPHFHVNLKAITFFTMMYYHRSLSGIHQPELDFDDLSIKREPDPTDDEPTITVERLLYCYAPEIFACKVDLMRNARGREMIISYCDIDSLPKEFPITMRFNGFGALIPRSEEEKYVIVRKAFCYYRSCFYARELGRDLDSRILCAIMACIMADMRDSIVGNDERTELLNGPGNGIFQPDGEPVEVVREIARRYDSILAESIVS